MCQAAPSVRVDSEQLERTDGNSPRTPRSAPISRSHHGACAGGAIRPIERAREPVHGVLGRGDAGWRRPVRNTPRSRGAGSGTQRFIAASPFRVIRTDRISHGGAGRDGCRVSQPLLAAEQAGDERSDASRRAKPDAAGRHPRGRARDTRLCAKTDQNSVVEALARRIACCPPFSMNCDERYNRAALCKSWCD
jgi:hypothetical protein